MKLLKLFGITTLITPAVFLLLSALFDIWMPVSAYILLTIIFAIPNFIGLTMLKGLYKIISNESNKININVKIIVFFFS